MNSWIDGGGGGGLKADFAVFPVRRSNELGGFVIVLFLISSERGFMWVGIIKYLLFILFCLKSKYIILF